MEEFDLNVIEKRFEPKEYMKFFKKPILYYMYNNKELNKFFFTFIIIDFQAKTIKYIFSYTKNNLYIFNQSDIKNLMRDPVDDIHSSIFINKNIFYSFLYPDSKYFYKIKLKTQKMEIMFLSDIIRDKKKKNVSIGPTLFKENKHIYFVIKYHKNDCYYVEYLKSSLDFKKLKSIYVKKIFKDSLCQHVIKKFGQFLLSSYWDFEEMEYELPHLNKKITGSKNLFNFILNDSFRNKRIPTFILNVYRFILFLYEKIRFIVKFMLLQYQSVIRNLRILNETEKIKLQKESGPCLRTPKDAFYHLMKKDFFSLSNFGSRYMYRPIHGKFSAYSLKDKKEIDLPTTVTNSAHFETTAKSVYISSHNFGFIDKIVFFGPAAIDKYSLSKNSLQKKGTFMCKDGYRYTTHKIFCFAGKEYICTVGRPNRLIFIETRTMTKVFHFDVKKNKIASCKDIRKYLTENDFSAIEIKTIVISENGRYIFLLGSKNYSIFDFKMRKIVDCSTYIISDDEVLNLNLATNKYCTSHCHVID